MWLGLAVTLALAAGIAQAGELVFRNGQRLPGELASRMLLISTGSDVVEVGADEVSVLTPEEVRLRDGRVVRGTLVGGQLRARTSYGELRVKIDDLLVFQAVEEPARPAAPSEPAPGAAPADTPAPAGPSDPPGPVAASGGPDQVAEGGKRIGRGVGDVAKGAARTVSEGVDRIHDGFKAIGLAIWTAMKSVGRTVEQAVTGPQDLPGPVDSRVSPGSPP